MLSQSPENQVQLRYWNSQGTVSQYSYSGAGRPAFLYPPELRMLGLFRKRWPTISMLDIGIGTGRTSAYFAELAGRYMGIDYAPQMVEACQRRLAGRWPGAEFQVGDATHLKDHADDSYDLVLFSFNGIDSVPYQGRERILREMRRVCRPGGWVVFSSHNLYSIPSIPKFKLKLHPQRLLEEMSRWRLVNRVNPPVAEAMAAPHIQYCDGNVGTHAVMFIRPEAQVVDLVSAGLEFVGKYGKDGQPLLIDDDGKDPAISWCYYYCRKPEAAEANE